jgi:hypothetical protein
MVLAAAAVVAKSGTGFVLPGKADFAGLFTND